MTPEATSSTPLGRRDSRAGKRIYLSLGSNRGDRMENLRLAMEQLGTVGVTISRVSPFYRSEPLDFAPQAWFLNCVVEAMTSLLPMQLLNGIKSVERTLGRRPGVAKGPRPIDIDILLYENVTVRTTALTIPHERMDSRRFVLVPLRELAPTLRHPITKRTVAEMLQDAPDLSQVIRYKHSD
jgi:2-amino-4-hydroxy-6-hydroxymethyldihydropteridine diphosphokinase